VMLRRRPISTPLETCRDRRPDNRLARYTVSDDHTLPSGSMRTCVRGTLAVVC